MLPFEHVLSEWQVEVEEEVVHQGGDCLVVDYYE